MELIDTHAHIDLPRFGDAAARLAAAGRAQAAGIVGIVVPGVEPATWDAMLVTAALLRAAVPGVGIHTAIGITRRCCRISSRVATEIKLRRAGDVGARGAAGDGGDRRVRPRLRARGREGRGAARAPGRRAAGPPRARAAYRPLVLHCLYAHAALLELVRAAPLPPSILHSWSGSAELAFQFCRSGHLVSFAGSITLPRARRPLENRRGLSLRTGC